VRSGGRARGRAGGRTAVAPALLLAVVTCSLVGLAAACTDDGDRAADTTTTDTPVSSTMVRAGDGALWVASPDDRVVVQVDAETLAERQRVSLATTPHHVLATSDGRVVVSGEGSELWVLGTVGEPTGVAVECAETAGMAELPAGAEGADGAEQSGGSVVAVTCPIDDRVVLVDVATGTVRGSIDAPGRPEAVAAAGAELVVLADHGGTVLRGPVPDLGGSGELAAPVELTAQAPWAPEGRGVSALDAVAVDGGEWVAAYQSIDNDTARDPTDPADTGSYGEVESGDARIQPMVTGACRSAASDFTDPTTAASGVHALAYDAAHDRVWVVGQYSASVLVLECADDPESPAQVVASFPVAVGASGIVVSDDGRSAWVDLAFDHAVARLELPDDVADDEGATKSEADGALAATEPTLVRAREVGPTQMTADALAGRRVFHDATDAHLTPAGVVTCASCHPGAGEDGRTWRIGTLEIESKLRRTPALQGLADGTKPFHADGGFDSLATLTTDTVRQLMAGDALLLDASSVSAYMAESRPDPAPFGLDPAAVERGRQLFASPQVGCVTCHTGASGSDGQLHRVDPRPTDPDALDGPIVTPRLVGLAARAPYFHDGSAATLDDVIEVHPDAASGPGTWLSDEQIADLVTYLRSR
jgi:mono/diheme cytochrome c family protein